jgi:nucleotidyltransferase substrate binding protein (TIGR01987 family)
MAALDFSSLTKAFAQFEAGLNALAENPENTLMRDGVIQRFEFTYELSHKLLKRYLEMTSPSGATIDQMAFPDLIRTGYEKGVLLSSWDKWLQFRKARNETSHTYDEAKAQLVLAKLPDFRDEVRFLLEKLKERAV